jgi:hypothetical protein
MAANKPTLVQAWHFTDGPRLRDGRKLPRVGRWLKHDVEKDGPVEICSSGLHASRRLLDAVTYAPGSLLHRVEVDVVDEHDDKLVGSRRRILYTVEAAPILRAFARAVTLKAVLANWPETYEPAARALVLKWLKDGDEETRSAAESAARSAARSAAESAAWSAARSAAWSAARSAARSAAWSAAESAAWSAAESAARSAAWSAAESAAGSAARSAARSEMNEQLERMVAEAVAAKGAA